MMSVLSNGVRALAKRLYRNGSVTSDQIIELAEMLGYSIYREKRPLAVLRALTPAERVIAFGNGTFRVSKDNPNDLVAFMTHALERLGRSVVCTERIVHASADRPHAEIRFRLAVQVRESGAYRSFASRGVIIDFNEARFNAVMHVFLRALMHTQFVESAFKDAA